MQQFFLNLNRKQAFWLVFFSSLFFCLLGSWLYPIYILDESKNAEAAREMLVRLDLITPTFNGVLRTDKPVLHYYFMMLGYKLFGVNAFGARFFSAVSGGFTIAIMYYFIQRFLSNQLAWISVGICWAAVFFIQEFHLAVPDPYLIVLVSSGCWCFLAFCQTNQNKFLWMMYVSLGLGVLVKGPVAIALTGLSFLIYLVLTKQLQWDVFSRFKVISGAALLVAIAAPWYVAVHYATDGAWTEGFFLKHNLNRFSNKMEGHGGPFILTWAFVLLGLMPFSFLIFKSVREVYHKRKSNHVLLFALVVSLVFIGFFSIAQTKLPNYPMPCYPFLTLLIAFGVEKIYERGSLRWHEKWVAILVLLLTFAIPIGGYVALQNDVSLAEQSTWALILFFPAIIVSVGVFFWFKNEWKKGFQLVVIGWVFIGALVFTVVYPKLITTSPVAKAQPILRNSDVIAYQRFDAAFPINLKEVIPVVNNEDELNAAIASNPNVILITNTRDSKVIQQLEHHLKLKLVLEQKALFETHTTRIFKLK